MKTKTRFSEANAVFKKHWWKFLIIDSLFLFFAFVFFIYTRARIKLYFLQISQYAAQINALQGTIQDSGAAGVAQIEELLSIISPIASQVSFFTFFIAPLVVFILWCLFQAPNYNLIARGKLFSVTHYIRFTVFTAPFFALGIYVLNKIFDIVYSNMFNSFKSWKFWLLMIALYLICYSSHAVYGFTLNKRYREIAKSGWCVLKRTPHMVLIFLLYAGIGIGVIVAMINFYLKWVGGVRNSMLVALIPVVLLLLMLSWARVYFTLKAMKCE